HLPIIFISAIYSRNYYHQKGLGVGAVDFITKPLVPQVFLGKVKIFLDLFTQRKELEEKVEEIKKSHITLKTILNNINANIYVSDMETHEILFANEAIKKTYGEDLLDKHCWDLQKDGQEGVCPACSNKDLLNDKGESAGIVSYETINQKNGHNFSVFDSALKWTDGRLVRLEIGIDIEKRVKAEEDLQKSNENFWELFNHSPDAIFVEDRNGKIIDVNATACRLQKYSRKELIGKSIFSLIPESQLGKTKKDFKNWFSGELTNIESNTVTKDGSTIPIEIHGSKISFNNDEALMLIVRDTTERQKAHKALKTSERRFRTLFETIPTVAVQGFDINREIIFWNKACESFYGYSGDEAKGKNFESLLIHNDQVEQVVEGINNKLESDITIKPQEISFKHKNGKAVPVLASFVVLENSGNQTEIYCLQIDLQERNRAQILQKNRLELIEFINKISSDFINIDVRDIDSTIIKAIEAVSSFTHVENGFVYLLSGKKEQFELSHEWSRNDKHSFNQKIEAKAYKELAQLISGNNIKPVLEIYPVSGKTNYYFEKPMKDMSLKSYVNMPMEVDGKFVGFICFGSEQANKKWDDEALHAFKLIAQIVTNALERKMADENVIKALEKATESDRLKTSFLANMSHEIRTPMNAIIGFSGLLSDPELTQEERVQFVSHINNNGNSLLTLINEILDIAKLEAGKIKINKSRCFINQVLTELHDFFEKEKKLKSKQDISFILNIPIKDDYFSIFTDPVRFRQIMTNLVGNSLKYTEGGKIEFGYSISVENTIRFYVKDTGIGIPESMKDYIFDRFRQVNESHTRGYGGTGLGLTISKNLVNLLGGEIWLDSKTGEGSTFYFTLPFDAKSLELKSKKIPLQGKGKYFWPEKMILVVEDVRTNFEFIEALLKRTNVDVIWAKDGIEAVDMFSENKEIDLVLMDIQMPRMNGYEATREIKKIRNETPIIAQTAYAMAEDRQKIFQSGCDDYISKPIKSDLLYSLIAKYF
ncbi:MAG: PAS domain S-box protein, partial [Bacteroidota bacterium]|nr:PAS domain S-box protein [Bacteroidota bacterium]